MFRGYSEILAKLAELQKEYKAQGYYERSVVCEAIVWGYSSARTIYLLEKYLITADDYRPMVEGVVGMWDGQGYLGGALAAAQSWGRRQGLYSLLLDELPEERTADYTGRGHAEAIANCRFRIVHETQNAYVIETIGDRRFQIAVPKTALVTGG